jgi:hypothetical protein
LANNTGTDKNSPIIFIPPSEQIISTPTSDDQLRLNRQPGFKYEADREAVETDMRLASEQSGIPLDTVKSSIAFQDAFYEYAEKVRARYPDQISDVWVQPVPATVGGIRFIGNAPLALSSAVKERGQGNQILLVGSGKILEQNHADYTRSVCEAVSEMDITNFICEYNVPAGRIDIEIHTPDKATVPNQSDILQSIQQRPNSSQLMKKGLILSPDDIHIEIKISNGSVFVPTSRPSGHRGGMKGFKNTEPGSFEFLCTTGWSVSDRFSSDTGIVTAGHCEFPRGGLDAYGSDNPDLYMKRKKVWYGFRTQDAAYYTNLSYSPVTPFFYSDEFDIRPVRHVKNLDKMIGSTVCRYGRATNFRSCAHGVTSTTAYMKLGDVWPYLLGPLVRITDDTSSCGDSGGGWSWGTQAWGVHTGRSNPPGFDVCSVPGQPGISGYFTSLEAIEDHFGVKVDRLPF